jgi:hypothetical protein
MQGHMWTWAASIQLVYKTTNSQRPSKTPDKLPQKVACKGVLQTKCVMSWKGVHGSSNCTRPQTHPHQAQPGCASAALCCNLSEVPPAAQGTALGSASRASNGAAHVQHHVMRSSKRCTAVTPPSCTRYSPRHHSLTMQSLGAPWQQAVGV